MIYLYSGTPGSGKSYHLAKDIYTRLRVRKKPVIANFPVSLEQVGLTHVGWIKQQLHRFLHLKFLPSKSKRLGEFLYVDNADLTVDALVEYSRTNLRPGVEGQALLIIDECAVIFNARAWDAKDRKQWITFFQQHRKLGYNVILVSQNDRLIDRQIRSFVEYEVKHRKVKNYKAFGLILSLLGGGQVFAAVTYWYGVREKVGVEFLRFRHRIADIYDTFALFG